jgi:hypothetical protein
MKIALYFDSIFGNNLTLEASFTPVIVPRRLRQLRLRQTISAARKLLCCSNATESQLYDSFIEFEKLRDRGAGFPYSLCAADVLHSIL